MAFFKCLLLNLESQVYDRYDDVDAFDHIRRNKNYKSFWIKSDTFSVETMTGGVYKEHYFIFIND